MNEIMIQRIYPVMVLYKCKLSESRTYQSLLKEADGLKHFMVYDNSPMSYEQDATQMPEGVTYIRDTSNSGLSIAYNKGAAKAKELGFSHILLLDQDTLFAANTWKAYNDNLDFNGIVAPLMITDQGVPFSPTDVTGLMSKAVKAVPGDYSLLNTMLLIAEFVYPWTYLREWEDMILMSIWTILTINSLGST